MLKETLRRKLMEAGAIAVGFARAGEIDKEAIRQYADWIAAGRHAGMEYLTRHIPLKSNTAGVLEDAATVISMAFSYAPQSLRPESLPVIAAYAWGDDYHDVIRRRLSPVADAMQRLYGGSWRICIDSAPIAERFWAMKSGIGRIGRNGSVIIDGSGSYVFLAEILTSHSIEPDEPSQKVCSGCGRCVNACPTGALRADATIDCRRCLNYLTIEHRGDWTGESLEAMHTHAGRHTLFGCDICQHVCPHNRDTVPTAIKEFYPRKGIIVNPSPPVNTPEGISGDESPFDSPERIMAMTQEEFSRIFRNSPLKRAKLAGLIRNASNLLP